MPRLTLYKPTKTNDYYFQDHSIREQFNIGGAGVHVHKYMGPATQPNKNDPSQPNYIAGGETDPLSGEYINVEGVVNETKIQDLLFMENRDRKYDPDIFDLRGVYNVQDNDFDLTQFGLFLSNDQLYMTFHINDMVEIMGRRLMPGDVLELPHLRDELLLNAKKSAVNKYYVVNDANRGAEGFSQTWYPHIWRVKLSPLTDSQEYYDILGDAQDDGSLKNDISTYKAEFNISDAIVQSAAQDDPNGTSLVDHLFGYDHATSGGIVKTDNTYNHGEAISTGDQFPTDAKEGDYFIRNDFSPNRMFARRGSRWHRLYDNITDKTWSDKTYNASDYIFNEKTAIFDNREYIEQHGMSQVILPKPDNYELGPEGGPANVVDPATQYLPAGYVAAGYVGN
mgnify:CR=1 FL=1|jgi:hypothetical protein|tara:strand:+ start:7665 stop:8849 length:1185 start_codon:yes stop_codon:yes gene_type:complete